MECLPPKSRTSLEKFVLQEMECEGEQHFGQLNNMNIESEKERISLNMPSMFCAGCKFSTEDVTSE